MGWSALVRGTILRRIRAQNATLNGGGSSLRPLSTVIRSEDEIYKAAVPGNVFLNGESLSFRPPRNVMPSEDKIYEAAASTVNYVREVISRKKNTGIVYKSLNVICGDPIFDSWCHDTKLKVLSRVFDQIRNYPQADPREVFLMKIYIRSMCNNDSKNDITKDEVISRVLDVIKSYPKVGDYKVTEETHFDNDLGFDILDYQQIWKALYLEFKLDVPVDEIVSCKTIIDYIHDNRMKRQSLEDFRKANICGDIFWPLPTTLK